MVFEETLDMSDSQGRALEVAWIVANLRVSHVEMRADQHGFHHQDIEDVHGISCNIGFY